MRTIRILALLATATVAFAASAKPSAAMVIYPWCAEYGGRSFGAENCGFVTFKQCLANPWYTPYPPPPSGARPIWR
jgi:hypothetical protein